MACPKGQAMSFCQSLLFLIADHIKRIPEAFRHGAYDLPFRKHRYCNIVKQRQVIIRVVYRAQIHKYRKILYERIRAADGFADIIQLE